MSRARKIKLNISGVPSELNDILDLVVKVPAANGYNRKITKSALIVDLLQKYLLTIDKTANPMAEKFINYQNSLKQETKKNISIIPINKSQTKRDNINIDS